MSRANKSTYLKVIQQHYGQGWEDVSSYETGSDHISHEKSGQFYTTKSGATRERSLIAHDLKEYRLTGYPTRVINRKEKKQPTKQPQP